MKKAEKQEKPESNAIVAGQKYTFRETSRPIISAKLKALRQQAKEQGLTQVTGGVIVNRGEDADGRIWLEAEMMFN